MKKFTLATLITLIVSLSTSAFADGNKALKQNDKKKLIEISIQNKNIDFSVNLKNSTKFRIVLFSENGEFMKVIDNCSATSKDVALYNVDKESLSAGNYVCMLETEEEVYSDFFTVEAAPDNLLQINYENSTHNLEIQASKKLGTQTLSIYHEDGSFMTFVDISGDDKILNINTSTWMPGTYVILSETSDGVHSDLIEL
jgi:hypothetical protein